MKMKIFYSVVITLFAVGLLLTSCAKKKPAETQPQAVTGEKEQTPETQPKKFTPEEETPTMSMEDSADYYNKQGVLKRIHFETDKAELLQESKEILKSNFNWLKAHPQFNVIIEGHCDERNTEDYNYALGERRANASKEYLIGLGIDLKRIKTVSYGEDRPIDPGHNEDAWQKNRRDEFTLSK